jgi:thiaminase (transcriptional activator TenA)
MSQRPTSHVPRLTTRPRFTDHLRGVADPIWRAQLEHRFVRGIGDGTLELERFSHWVRQDYLFLVEYCRLFGLAASRAPDLETLGRFAELLHATARTEMDLHRGYARELGISESDMEREVMGPVTRGYTDFLVRVAATGDFAELAAALLPCMWGFSEIGQALKARGLPAEARYARWIEMYADPDFAALAEWCRGLVDRLAADASDDQRRRMEEAFITSSRYEYMFWDASDRLERWPV